MIRRSLQILVVTALGGATVAQGQHQVPTCEVRGSREWLAQRASPLDSAEVTLEAGTAKVCYSRPSARGRQVFGGIVEYGKLWRTGANEPTVLHLPFAAEVAGVRLEPGRYMFFTVPRPDSWLIAFYTSDATDAGEMFRTMQPVAQGTATTEPLSTRVDTFTIRGVGGDTEGQLLLEWEHVRVRVPIRSLPNPALEAAWPSKAAAGALASAVGSQENPRCVSSSCLPASSQLASAQRQRSANHRPARVFLAAPFALAARPESLT